MGSHSRCFIVQNPARPCPPEVFGQLVSIPVRFIVFLRGLEKKFAKKVTGQGVIEVHRDLATDVEALFQFMLAEQFPLSCVMPIVCFGWNDKLSMAANNTSGFNYRMIADTQRLSKHACGRAIDINPMFNPWKRYDVVEPKGAVYDPSHPGTLTADSPVTQFLKARGWIWGGDWVSPQDYQHFEKPE